jgi:cytochrome c-type biogenesis protein CcmH/NrfF
MKNRPLPEIRRVADRSGAVVGVLMLLMIAVSTPVSAIDVVEHEKATAAILCDCGCHPQSVKDCACGRAAEMRREIADAMENTGGGAPLNGEEVIALYVAEHGEQILVAPPARGFNLVAWLAPFALLIAALFGVTLLIRRLARRSPMTTAVAGAPTALDPGDPYVERLQRELEERQ